MYIILLKNDVAMSKAKRETLDTLDMFSYDNYVVVTKEVFDKIKLPARLINGKWVKTDDIPVMEYQTAPEKEDETPTGGNSVYDEIAEAYRKGVQEA